MGGYLERNAGHISCWARREISSPLSIYTPICFVLGRPGGGKGVWVLLRVVRFPLPLCILHYFSPNSLGSNYSTRGGGNKESKERGVHLSCFASSLGLGRTGGGLYSFWLWVIWTGGQLPNQTRPPPHYPLTTVSANATDQTRSLIPLLFSN